MLKPLRDMVLVKPELGPKQTEGGIIIPETAEEHELWGRVVAVGPGRTLDTGEVKPVAVQKGERVLYWMNRAPSPVTVHGEKHLLLNEAEIFAVERFEDVPVDG